MGHMAELDENAKPQNVANILKCTIFFIIARRPEMLKLVSNTTQATVKGAVRISLYYVKEILANSLRD